MAFWPFRRSKKAKNAKNAGATEATEATAPLMEKQPLSEKVQPSVATPRRAATPTGGNSTKRSPTAPETFEKASRSMAPSRDITPSRSNLRGLELGVQTVIYAGTGDEQPLTPRSGGSRGRSKSRTRKLPVFRSPLRELSNPAVPHYQQDAGFSRTSLVPGHEEDDFTAIPIIPTLTPIEKPLPGGLRTPRRSSSKRKAEDNHRIEELRTMSRTSPIPIPIRPDSAASGLIARESRRSLGLIRRPNSQVSLPLAESLHNSTPDVPESTSYKVNAFDILAPRPTIKYNSSPRYLSSSYRRDAPPALPEVEEDWSSRARMEELADGLDNRALRELMDRDRRRRDRKSKLQSEKLARKLEKQELEEKEKEKRRKASRSRGRSKGKRKEEGESASKTGTQSGALPRLDVLQQPQTGDPRPVSELLPGDLGGTSRDSPVSPLDDPFHDRMSTDYAVIETAREIRLDQTNFPASSPPILSQPAEDISALDIKQTATPDIPEMQVAPPHLQSAFRRDSENSSRNDGSGGGSGGGWRGFFQRSYRKARTSSERGRVTPSESGFSNASRESFARSGPSVAAEASFVRIGGSGGPAPPIPQRSFRRAGTPQRTRSKFREDLPDLPREDAPPVPELPTSQPRSPAQSPPQSPTYARVYSPEGGSGPPSPFVDNPNMLSTRAAVNAPMENVHPALREEVALSRGHSVRSSRRNSATAPGASVALLSQSLASVDSEGSWLSGRPGKRSSTITGRPSSNSIGASPVEDDEREAGAHSPLIFSRRTYSIGNGNGHTNGGAGSSISNQLRTLRHPSQISDSATVEERTPLTPERSTSPTPRRSTLESHPEHDISPESGDIILHTASVARSPNLVNRAEVVRSREGLLDIFDPQPGDATAEPAASPDEESPEERNEAEPAEIQRATSVSLRERGHGRQISAGSARLLDISRRGSGEAPKFGDPRRESVGSDIGKSGDARRAESGKRSSRLMQTTSATDDEDDVRPAE